MPTDADVPDVPVMPGEINLSVHQDEKGQAHTMVPVSWCPSPDLVERMKAEGIQDAHMLIVVTNNGDEVTRDVVPLIKQMTYVQFRRTGTNRVHAAIVYGGNPKRKLRKKEDRGRYACPVVERRDPMLDPYRDPWGDLNWSKLADKLGRGVGELQEESAAREETLIVWEFSSMNRLPEEGVQDVVVSEAFFAKPPPKILQWIVGQLPWEGKVRDQCHFKQRLLVSIPLVLPWLALRALADYPIPSFLALAALILQLFGVLGVVVTAIIGILPILASIAIGVGLAYGFAWVFNKVFSRRAEQWSDRWHEKRDRKQAAADAAARKAYLKELESLACGQQPQPKRLEDLPRHRQTVRLRFLKAKSERCEAYAEN